MNNTKDKTKIKALIIDDEVDVCFLLSGLLKQKNLETDFVNNLTEALNILQEREPAVIFLDNHLPDGFGVDYISNIKTKLPYAKVVMITAHDTTSDREKALQSGADHFIGKPFTRDAIYQTLEHLTA
jgi:CheY-like chemotaxis protein